MKTGEEQRKAWDGGRSGRPAPAFDDAAHGSRGWGIRPADVAVGATTLLAALGVCCMLWFGFGVQGVPGVSMGEGSGTEVGEGVSVVTSGAESSSASTSGDLDAQASGLDGSGSDVQALGLDAAGSNDKSLGLDAGGLDAQASGLDAGGVNAQSSNLDASGSDVQASDLGADGLPASSGESAANLGLDADGLPAASGQGSADLGIDAGSTYTASDAGDVAAALYAVIQNSDGFYQVFSLGEDATVTVTGSLGTNIIEVANGRVRCLESDCSNQTCVKQGWVSGRGQTVVCLPHKLIVQVVADPADAVPLS